MKNNLKALRKSAGMSQHEAAEKFGMSYDGYKKKELGVRRLESDFIKKACVIFGVSEGAVIGFSNSVPLVGYVGAGNSTHYYANGDSLNEEVDRPPESTENTVAVQVKGDSMFPIADDGDLIYFDEVRTPPTDDIIGKLCAVGLPDDRILVKRLTRSRDQGRFDLISTNASPMIGVEILWAARVKWIKPR